MPRGVVTETVDRATGYVVDPACPPQGETYTEYFVHVYGFGGAVNPNYQMSITGPAIPADRFEPNDTASTARNLGASLSRHLAELRALTPAKLVDLRYDKFRQMGAFVESAEYRSRFGTP